MGIYIYILGNPLVAALISNNLAEELTFGWNQMIQPVVTSVVSNRKLLTLPSSGMIHQIHRTCSIILPMDSKNNR